MTTTELKKLLFFYDSKNTNMAGPPSSQSELSHEHTYQKGARTPDLFCFTKLLTTWPRYPMSIF